MKKSVALLTSAALAFSMFASAAMADPAKTASDYKDLSNLDAGLKTKIDTLLAKGIFEGVTDDSFGITQNMTRAQFAKVASLVFGLPVDMSVTTSSFSDVVVDDPANGWAIPYIEAAKKAGLIDGMTEKTFAPGNPVTVGQLDTVFVKGMGKTISMSASPWYADAVKQAKELGIHPADKNGDVIATRADLVTGAFGSLPDSQNPQQQNLVSVISVTANGERAVDVKLDKAVDNSEAKLTLTKDGAVIPTTVAWSSDRNAATLTFTDDDTKLSNGTYKVTLTGLSSSLIKTASSLLIIGNPGPSTSSGNINYSIPDTYELKDVIDSGITGLATGNNGYASKSEAEDPTVSLFAKEIVFKATNTSGDEVALGGIIQSITSSSPSIVKVALSSDHKGYILGNKAGSATVDIVFSTGNGTKQMSIPVQVKSDGLTAELIEARDLGSYKYLTVSGSVYSGRFNAYESMDLKITDNFGIEYEQNEIQSYNFALGTSLFPEDIVGNASSGPVGTVTIDNDGTVNINGNVTEFTLTAMLPNGKRVSSDIHVRTNGAVE